MTETTDTQPVELLLIEDSRVDIRTTKQRFKDHEIAYNLHVTADREAGMLCICKLGEYPDAPHPDLIF